MCFGRFVAASNIVHTENDRCHVYTASTTRIYHSKSTTLRYFPALKEEFVHINAAMKLQNISWASRLECTVVPLIVSAVNTSDEIAAAAVARGIENPGKKTSEITLHMGISDWLIMILVTFGILIVVIAG